MTNEQIEQLALANGFKLKEQPDGSMALNPYVFEFARAVAKTALEATPMKCGEYADEITDFTVADAVRAQSMFKHRDRSN